MKKLAHNTYILPLLVCLMLAVLSGIVIAPNTTASENNNDEKQTPYLQGVIAVEAEESEAEGSLLPLPTFVFGYTLPVSYFDSSHTQFISKEIVPFDEIALLPQTRAPPFFLNS